MPPARQLSPRVVASCVVVLVVVLAMVLGLTESNFVDSGNPFFDTSAAKGPGGSSSADAGKQHRSPAPSAPPSTVPSKEGSTPGSTSPPPMESTPQGTPTTVLHYTFDSSAVTTYTDIASRLTLHEQTAQGATLTAVPHGSGFAVGFPAPCPTYGAPECPRAVLTSEPAPWLNPGARDIRYGASILLAADATTKGENILQKGLSTTGESQFKLQVDGYTGQPSCVMVGINSHDIHVALSSRTVADGAWHQLSCFRTADVLAILMDGQTVGSVLIPATLAINNDRPLEIGGNGSGPGNDQFNGQLDDVFVQILG